MFAKPHKINQYRRKRRNLINTNKIKPEQWKFSKTEVKAALKAQGYDVKQIKKIHCLKYQICISYWDTKGNVCSSFFSYRIFPRWQREVEKLIYSCQTAKEWKKLNYLLHCEFTCYCYPREMENVLYTALENRLSALKLTAQQAVFLVI